MTGQNDMFYALCYCWAIISVIEIIVMLWWGSIFRTEHPINWLKLLKVAGFAQGHKQFGQLLTKGSKSAGPFFDNSPLTVIGSYDGPEY